MRAIRLAPAFALVLVAIATGCEEPAAAPPEAILRIAPAALDFGNVLFATAKTLEVSVINDGAAPYQPAVLPGLEGVDAAAFSIVEPCALPLAPQGLCRLAIVFAPLDARGHEAVLRIGALDGGDDVLVAIRGDVSGVRFSPSALDFGGVVPFDTATRQVTVENVGSEEIEVPLLVEGDDFRIAGEPTFTLAAGASAVVDVEFRPEELGAVAGRLIADLCDGTDCDPATVLTGLGGNPALLLSPTLLAFGEIDVGDAAQGTVTLSNQGNSALLVTALDIEDATASLTVAEGPALPATLAPGQAIDVVLRYAPTQGAALAATLHVLSSDPDDGVLDVEITGLALGAGLVAEPPALDFGTLDEGGALELEVVLTSSGTDAAVIESIAVADPFSVVNPPSLPLTLLAGDTLALTVRALVRAQDVIGGASGVLAVSVAGFGARDVPLTFAGGDSGCDPRADIPQVDLGNSEIGVAESGTVTVANLGTAPCVLQTALLGSGLPSDPEFSFDASGLALIAPGASAQVAFTVLPTGIGALRINVEATFENVAVPVTVAAIAVGVDATLFPTPALIAFPAQPEGCAVSEDAVVAIANLGILDAQIDSITIEPPGAPFALVNPPLLPLTIDNGATLSLAVVRLVDSVGTHQATLVLRGPSANTVRVALTLSVVPVDTPVVEQIIASEVKPLDILFIIDNSGSMSEDQAQLADNFQRFVEQPTIANEEIDFHLGVTTTDIFVESGRLVGSPTILTIESPDFAAAFSRNALVGANGSADERGLQAMELALSEPNLSVDNAGFYRAEAALAVLIVSDEEDFSVDTVAHYTTFLTNLKAGGLGAAGVNVSAVRDSTTQRYDEIVGDFGGVLLDIDSPVWGEELAALGESIVDLPQLNGIGDDRFRTLHKPIAVGLVVTVDGVATTVASVDSATRLIKLVTPAPAGSLVEITYRAVCP